MIALLVVYTGNDLPKKYGEFPRHMASIPIVDLDPYYEDKLTFMVISSEGSLFRFTAKKSLFLLSPFHPIRRVAIRVLTHRFFSMAVITTILANCYAMIKKDNE